MNSMGTRISSLRKFKGLTQIELAEKLNISDKAVSKWESGVGFPSLEMVGPLSDCLGCSIDFLIRGHNIKNKESNNIVLNYLKKDQRAADVFWKAVDYFKKSFMDLYSYGADDALFENLEPIRYSGKYMVVLEKIDHSCRFKHDLSFVFRRFNKNIDKIIFLPKSILEDDVFIEFFKYIKDRKNVTYKELLKWFFPKFEMEVMLEYLRKMYYLGFIEDWSGGGISCIVNDEEVIKKVKIGDKEV